MAKKGCTMNSGKTIKRIFLSDIHMGDGRSVTPGGTLHPYCWFDGGRPGMLALFLEQYCIADGTVDEVVILGDFFDEWICPTQFDPTDPAHPIPPQGQQFTNIADAPQNRSVIEGFQRLAAQNRLTYLTGNHDMLADKAVIAQIFPGIGYVDDADGHSVYHTADGIWAEHGHWYGLFNAPYLAGSGGGFNASILPLGFFISRISADEALKTGNSLSPTPTEVFKKWIGHILSKVPDAENLAKARDKIFQQTVDHILMELFDILVSDYAADPKGGALLNGLDGIPGIVTWQDVEKRYGHIFSEWENSHADDVNAYYAIWCDAGNLDPAALSVFFYHEEAKIVICGHTHKPECTSALGDFDTRGIIIDTPVASGTNPIYANTGAWVNDTPRCTFVETEFDTAAGTHSVRLREWTQTANGQCVAQKVPLCPDESLSV
jgi:UDP-2,3-diacylglucosamine pyrophosphatase LpxH